MRAGNWLTQWQRSHLSHHWQPTALGSSNFLRRYQIVPMIASSWPGSGSFHDSMLFPRPPTSLIHILPISLEGALKVVTNLGLLREINGVGKTHLYGPWQTGEGWWRCLFQITVHINLCNTLACHKMHKHPKRAPLIPYGKFQLNSSSSQVLFPRFPPTAL